MRMSVTRTAGSPVPYGAHVLPPSVVRYTPNSVPAQMIWSVASLAARMGSTPSATSTPVYDSAVDLDGTGTVDDADVSALTSKFGSTIP